jgi:GTPase SAR1 family protein
MDAAFDYQFRLILIGDSTVGKSSLLKYFTDNRFAEVSALIIMLIISSQFFLHQLALN